MILAGNDIDVVVSDERMPGMTGSQFLAGGAQAVAEHHPHDPLGPGGSVKPPCAPSTRARLYRFLLKPVTRKELQQTIQLGLQHKKLVAQSPPPVCRST
jgi:DNA-binding NtrC family response regulator